MNQIDEKQKNIVEEFSIFSEWLDKYSLLIEKGKLLLPLAENEKTPQNLIEGCQSRVWISATLKDGKVFFSADSDAIITKGIIALLLEVFSGETPDAILDSNLTFIDEIGLRQNLSPTRANGLLSMIKQIKSYAIAYKLLAKKTNNK